MAEIQFSKNYNDHCVHTGANAGFQFEFFCERCNDTWRSEFVPYRSGRASGWLSKASGFASGLVGGTLGNVGHNVSSAAETLAEAGYGKARDEAFAVATEQARTHFHRCASCSNYVCDRCWNSDGGLCLQCAPDSEVAIQAARAAGEADKSAQRAREEGERRAEKRDTKRDRQLVCPECNAETHGSKFCPECGAKLAVRAACPSCGSEVPGSPKFCPECGAKMGA